MGSSTKNISYRYDAVGNQVGMTDPDGGRFTYSYDSLRRMTRVINPQGERTSYSYDDVGRRTLMKLANGTRTSYTYDPANRLTTLGNLKSDGTVISQFDYKYDNVGNRTAVKEFDGSRVTYTYDNLSQLTGEHRTGTTPYRNTYTYDSRGNRTLKNENNVRTTYVYDACNQLNYSIAAGGRTTYTFDNDGNQTKALEPTGARTTTTWDYENKTTLVQLPSGVRNTMSYDTEGMRIKLEDSSGVKKYVWDQQNYLAETDAANDTQVAYTNEPQGYGNLISQRRNNSGVWTPSYYHYEALGSTRQLTNSSQTVTDTYLYDAWGNLITSTGTTVNPFRYVGRLGYYYDADTTNSYIRARIYRPVIARWLSVDPLGFVDGLNFFKAYFAPWKVDPLGLNEEKCKVTDGDISTAELGFYNVNNGAVCGIIKGWAEFATPCCNCCHFRQYVKGFCRIRQKTPTRTTAWTYCQTNEPLADYIEDCHDFGNDKNVCYGHREDTRGINQNDEYTKPDRESGCRYDFIDPPGAITTNGINLQRTLDVGLTVEIEVRYVFKFKIVDVCKNKNDPPTVYEIERSVGGTVLLDRNTNPIPFPFR